jgi:serine/threonine protein kinase
MTQSISCLKTQDLQNFLDGAIAAERGEEIEEHLTNCSRCREALQLSAGDGAWWQEVEQAMLSERDSADETSPFSAFASWNGLLGPTDDPGKLGRIGSYEVVGLLGQGGMGAVFKAFDAGLNRFVAIKVLLPQLAASGAARSRFRREGQAAAAVVNDHVLPIYAVDEWRNIPYLVMQYVRGATLQRRLAEKGPLRLEEILRIGLHAAKGLAAAHAQGLVHRDVKPSNILLDGSVDRAILSDFGLARAVDDASLTRSGMLAGTPQYMSPEQVRGDQLDQRSDLFSLGSVLYAMSTGHPPFRAESSYAVMRRIIDETPRDVREFRADLPDWLPRLIAWLMAKHPSDRPASAKQVEELLQQCLAHWEQPQLVSLPAVLARTQVTTQTRGNGRVIMYSTSSILLGLLIYSGMGWLSPAKSPSDEARLVASEADTERKNQDAENGWEPYSSKRLDELLASNQPVLVFFRADWCLSCNAQEKQVLASRAVKKQLDELGVIRLKADITNPSPEIEKFLKELGNDKATVPYYAFYRQGEKSPECFDGSLATSASLLKRLEPLAASADPLKELEPLTGSVSTDDPQGSTTSGGYRISVAGVGSLSGMESLLDFRPDLFRQQMQGSESSQSNTQRFGDRQSFNSQSGAGGFAGGASGGTAGGFGSASGGATGSATSGGGGFASGGGATHSGVSIQPNCGIALSIEPENSRAKKQDNLVRLGPKLKVTDRQGQVSESEDTGALRISYPQFQRQFPNSQVAYLNLPQGAETEFRKIEGVLLLTPGRRVEAVFTGTDPQTKKSEGETFRLGGFQTSGQGVQIQLTFPETKALKQGGDPFAKFEAFQGSFDAYEVSFEDDEGNVYLPMGKTNSGNSSGNVQGFSFNGSSQTRSNQSPEPSFSSMTFIFKPLKEGRKIRKIVATMVEAEGEEKAVPFTIEVGEK